MIVSWFVNTSISVANNAVAVNPFTKYEIRNYLAHPCNSKLLTCSENTFSEPNCVHT